MSTKADILKYIDRLEQDIQTLRTMVATMDDTHETVSQNEPIPAVLIDTDSPEELVAQFLVAVAFDIVSRDQLLSQLLHGSIIKHSPAMDSFLRFNFKTLQNRWNDYLADPSDPHSFTITRQQRNDRKRQICESIYRQPPFSMPHHVSTRPSE